MSKGSYLGGGTIIRADRYGAGKRSRRLPVEGLLTRAVKAASGQELKRSEFMPPLMASPAKRRPSPAKAGNKAAIAREEHDHFNFGQRTRSVVLEEMGPILRAYAKNGITGSKEVARLLNKAGFKTACGEVWTPRLASILQKFLYEERQARREKATKDRATRSSLSPATPKQAPLSKEELARRLKALGRITSS